MKNKFRSRFKKQILKSIFVSGVITAVAEFFLVMNLSMIGKLMEYRSRFSGIHYRESYIYLITCVVLILIGMVIFAVSFLILENKEINLITEIYDGIKKLAAGDLNTHVEVVGDGEFSEIAMEINHLGEEIKNLIERERKSEKTKHELITNIAHDLRTPLTSIIGYVELLHTSDTLTEEQRSQYTAIVLTKAKRLEHLIEDLFGLTKLNYGKITMNVERIDIVNLLAQLLEEAYPSFADHHLEYELKTNERKIEINGDGNLLARLFDNIISNAIKYGKDGKRIIVGVEGEEKSVTVKVINYGKIIPKEELPYIFEKFYRVEQSRSEETGGTGLGLAIARDIVQLHGGVIRAESSLKGTVFIIRLTRDFDPNKEIFERVRV